MINFQTSQKMTKIPSSIWQESKRRLVLAIENYAIADLLWDADKIILARYNLKEHPLQFL